MAMVALKIPSGWRDKLIAFRDAIAVEKGEEAIAALASLAKSENGREAIAQLPALAEAVRQNPKSTLEAIAAVTEGEPLPAPASADNTALLPPTIQGRAIPSALAGMVGEILELWGNNPSEAKRVLSEALSAKVQPATPIPPAGTVPVVLRNDVVDRDSFQLRGSRFEIPCNVRVNILPADLEAIAQQLASRQIDRFSPAPRSELVRC